MNPSSTYWKNIAPRIGLAYSVTPKTVVRASYKRELCTRQLDQRQPVWLTLAVWLRERSGGNLSDEQRRSYVLLGQYGLLCFNEQQCALRLAWRFDFANSAQRRRKSG